MTQEDSLFLSDIYEAILKIEDYTQDGCDTFMQTPMIQDAVIRNFEIIGEATKRLSDELRRASSDIRWQQVAGLRDVLIHGYRSVRLIRIWNIIEQDLPLLKDRVRTLLSTLDNT